MLDHYFVALMSLGRNRQRQDPAPPVSTAEAASPADPPAAGANGSTEWDPCPCRQWGVDRADRHGCAALVKELFPQLDQELDAWEAEHGWLYR
jgi:hypothetical protein